MNRSIAAPMRLVFVALWITLFVLSEPLTGHAQEQYTLTVSVEGQGEVVCQPPGTSFSANQTVQLTAVAATGWGFSGWLGSLSGSSNPATISMSGNKSVTANFSQYEYALKINVNGSGSVARVPDKTAYTHGEQVRLSATPASGFIFSGWGQDLSGNTSSAIVTIDGPKTITASFTRAPTTPAGGDGPPDGAGNQSGGSIMPAASGGSLPGGGGGGVFQSDRTYLVDYIDVSGAFVREASARSDDGFVKLTIPSGVTAKTAEGVNVSWVELYPVKTGEPGPPAPQGGSIAGACYRLNPEGTTFNPMATITIFYSQTSVPVDVKEDDLVIGYYDAASQKWTILPGNKVDASGNTITASIRTLGIYAILRFLPQPAPPNSSPRPTVIPPTAPAAGEGFVTSTVAATVRPAETPEIPATSERKSPPTTLSTQSTVAPAPPATALPRLTESSAILPGTSSTLATVGAATAPSESPPGVTSTIPPPATSDAGTDTRTGFPVVWLVASALVVFILVLAVTLIRGGNRA